MSRELCCFREDLSQYGQILALETSPFNLSQDVILIGFEATILLGHLKIDEKVELDILAEFKHPSRCTSLSISPETSLNQLPCVAVFAAGSSDYKLRVFRSDLKGENVCKVLDGHTSYVNDVKYDPENNFLVSVSDDNTGRVWETENYNCVATLQLTSPGMSACWHREDYSKLLIAEKGGLIRFYNVETQSPILSLDYGKPLTCAHWSPTDSQIIGSLQLGELLVWDLTKPCVPMGSSLIFTEMGGEIKFSPSGDLVAAVNGLEGTLKVVSAQSRQLKLSVGVTLPSNVCWHFRAPIVCVGDYKTLCFWRMTPT